jgi:hypothetical protein
MFRSDSIAHQRKQDWPRLRKIVAPTLLVGVSPTVSFSSSMHETLTLPAHIQIDYTHVSNRKWEKIDAEDFINMMSDPGFLGDPLLKTQHLLGATEWVKVADTEIIGHHQLRVAHLRYSAPDFKVEEKRGHSHATNEHYYHKVDGVWKFAGL